MLITSKMPALLLILMMVHALITMVTFEMLIIPSMLVMWLAMALLFVLLMIVLLVFIDSGCNANDDANICRVEYYFMQLLAR